MADSWCTVTASPFSNHTRLCEGWISIREKALSLPLWNLAKKQFITSEVEQPAENPSGGGSGEDKGDDAESEI